MTDNEFVNDLSAVDARLPSSVALRLVKSPKFSRPYRRWVRFHKRVALHVARRRGDGADGGGHYAAGPGGGAVVCAAMQHRLLGLQEDQLEHD